MLGTITKNDGNFQPLPDNVYLAKVLKVVEKAPPASHPDWYPSLSWQFQLLQEPFKNRRAFGKTPCNWLAGKKLDSWLVTCGINVGKGTSIKIEDIKDIYVKILVKGKKYNDKQTGEEKIFSEVTELLPLDSIDQVKIRELVAGVPTAVSQPVPVVSQQPVIQTQPTVSPVAPVAPTVTAVPSRTIPF
jgi:hypothetical protein